MEYDHPAKSGIEPVRARPDEPELGRVECELRQRTSGILKVALPPEWMRAIIVFGEPLGGHAIAGAVW